MRRKEAVKKILSNSPTGKANIAPDVWVKPLCEQQKIIKKAGLSIAPIEWHSGKKEK